MKNANVKIQEAPEWLKELEKVRENEDTEYIILIHKKIPGNQRDTVTTFSTPEAGRVLCEMIINNAIQLGEVDGMLKLSEMLITIGQNAIRNINRETERRSNEN